MGAEQPYGDIGTARKKKTMLHGLIRAQTTGKGFKSLRQLPAAVYGRLQSTTEDVAPLCIELENALVAYDVDSCQEV